MTIYNVVITKNNDGVINNRVASFTTSEKANEYLSSQYESYKTDRSLINDEEWDMMFFKDAKFNLWYGGFNVDVIGEVIACELQ